jgi:uncharacterized caspase-like protein
MRVVGAILFAIWASGLACQPALAEKRIALAIGNSNYQNVSHLANPANDAATLAATFRKANFDIVTLRVDLSAIEMRRALRDFGEKARDADIAVVYYAGHGIEVDGINYLIPVDAALERDTDIYDEALSLERVLIAVEPARALRLIILDACRDNPFAKHMKQKIARRSVGRGLAKVEPPSPDTMIAFAAKAGFTASDGDDRKTSPFAAALAEHLTKPGLDLRKAFGFVRDDVLKATDNRQEPFIYGSLGGDDVALVPAPAVAPPANPAPYPNEAIRHDYELAERVGTREVWDSFLSTHPDGFYAKLAQAQHNKLAAEEGRVAATEKARLAAEERARLAAEGAKAADQAKAAVTAKAAEEARVTAEKKKAQEEARLAEAERAKAAAQAKASEEARIAGEKARKLEQEKANQERIAAEKKKAQEEAKAAEAERAKAAAQAKAAEEARIAAEKARKLEEEKLNQERIAAEKKAQEEAKAAEAERAKAAAQAKAAEDARIAADNAKATEANKASNERPIGALAALTPAEQAGETNSKAIRPTAEDIPRLLQTELHRVGCYNGAIDGDWNVATRKSVGLFNKHASATLDIKVASIDALDIVRGKTARICPLICDHGYKADGDTCTRIICKAGFEVGDDSSCERIRSKKPGAKHESKPEQRPASANLSPSPAREPSSTGGRRCVATSCSQAVNGCMRRCSRNGVDCTHCSAEYNRCIRTGTFIGNVCQLSGLARN